jgi:hypothetical protein
MSYNITNDWMRDIVMNNTNLNFVNRIANPHIFPVLDLGDGDIGTHRMAWATVGDQHIVYPTIIQDPESGSLTQMTPEDAKNYALRTGEYIPFTEATQADYFSRNYKQLWDEE